MTTMAFVRVRDEAEAREMCWQGVLKSWQTTGQPQGERASFDAGWEAGCDYHLRGRRDVKSRAATDGSETPAMGPTESFSAVGRAKSPDKPPRGPMAATVSWYFERAKLTAPEQHDAFLRGWNGAALWIHSRQTEKDYADASRSRRALMKAIGGILESSVDYVHAMRLLSADGTVVGRCVACGCEEEVFCIAGEMACIDCIEARIDAVESDLEAVRDLVRPNIGESLVDACRRQLQADEQKKRLRLAYERGVVQVINLIFARPARNPGEVAMDVFHVVKTESGFQIDPNLPSTMQCVADLSGPGPVDESLLGHGEPA